MTADKTDMAAGPADRALGLEEALALLLKLAKPVLETQLVQLEDANGRIAACDLASPLNLPSSANAAVDGVAVQADFIAQNPGQLLVIKADIRAGHPFAGELAIGEAARIYTGAVMPAGADSVVMQEHCRFDKGRVFVDRPVARGMNSRPAGENLRKGEILLHQGSRIGAAETGQLAAAGIDQLPVFRQLTAGLVSTGDELAGSGTGQLAAGQIYDSNRPMLAALLAADGLAVRDYGILRDDRAQVAAKFRQILDECDFLISSGGASGGIEDHCQAAMLDIGGQPVLKRLAIKPGRPMSAGVRQSQMMFSLPGNPVAVYVCYRLLVSPVLDQLAGGRVRQPMRLPLPVGFDLAKQPGRAEYMRVRLEADDTGQPVMQLHGRKGAGVISSLVGADGLVEIPFDHGRVKAGMMLNFIPF